jgi:hypothetical protein
MSALSHPVVATSAYTCWGCPEQYEGQLVDGRFFYFRFRWGVATLGLGITPDAAVEDDREARFAVGDNLRGVFDDDLERDLIFARLLAERIITAA